MLDTRMLMLAFGLAVGSALLPVGVSQMMPAGESSSLITETAVRDETFASSASSFEALETCIADEDEDDEASQEGSSSGDGSEETNETGDEPEQECIVDETQATLKDELDDLPPLSYCKRINGRITCIGFNSSDVCAVFFAYNYPVCLKLWKEW